MGNDEAARFAHEKYLNLETYRRAGTPVRTPVWFAPDDQDPRTLYIYTLINAGKVKRIRNNPGVRVAPCTMGGTPTGDWTAATARLVEGAEAARAQGLLNRKYWMKPVGDFFSRLRGRKQQIIALRLADIGLAGAEGNPAPL